MSLPVDLLSRMHQLGLCVEEYRISDNAEPTAEELRSIEEAIILPYEQQAAEYSRLAPLLKVFARQRRQTDPSLSELSQEDLLKRKCLERELRKWNPHYSPEWKRSGKVVEVVVVEPFAVSLACECPWYGSEHVVVVTPAELSQWVSENSAEIVQYLSWRWEMDWQLLERLPNRSVWRQTMPVDIDEDRLWFVLGHSTITPGHPSAYGVWWERTASDVRFIKQVPAPGYF